MGRSNRLFDLLTLEEKVLQQLKETADDASRHLLLDELRQIQQAIDVASQELPGFSDRVQATCTEIQVLIAQVKELETRIETTTGSCFLHICSGALVSDSKADLLHRP